MPNPDNPDMKLRGRVYVCDLAGTEPAGDIFYAQYEKKHYDDGSFEYKVIICAYIHTHTHSHIYTHTRACIHTLHRNIHR